MGRKMRNLKIILVIFIMIFATFSCKKDKNDDDKNMTMLLLAAASTANQGDGYVSFKEGADSDIKSSGDSVGSVIVATNAASSSSTTTPSKNFLTKIVDQIKKDAVTRSLNRMRSGISTRGCDSSSVSDDGKATIKTVSCKYGGTVDVNISINFSGEYTQCTNYSTNSITTNLTINKITSTDSFTFKQCKADVLDFATTTDSGKFASKTVTIDGSISVNQTEGTYKYNQTTSIVSYTSSQATISDVTHTISTSVSAITSSAVTTDGGSAVSLNVTETYRKDTTVTYEGVVNRYSGSVVSNVLKGVNGYIANKINGTVSNNKVNYQYVVRNENLKDLYQ